MGSLPDLVAALNHIAPSRNHIPTDNTDITATLNNIGTTLRNIVEDNNIPKMDIVNMSIGYDDDVIPSLDDVLSRLAKSMVLIASAGMN